MVRVDLTSGTSRPIRVCAFHLTRTSSSEAKVLASVLGSLDDSADVDLVLNVAARDDPGCHFASLEGLPSVTMHWLDVGLPADPQKPRPKWRRVVGRAEHVARRPAAVRLVRALRPDVVYTSQQRFDSLIGRQASRALAAPHVLHLHYTPGDALKASTMRLLGAVDRVIAVSRFIAERAVQAGVDPAKVIVLPNTLVVSPGSQAERHGRDGVTIGQTGRVEPEKGFVDTVEAFTAVHRRHGASRLVLVGDGSDRPALERAVETSGVAAAIELSGWRADIDRLLDEMDVFVHPSRGEPFGMAVLEAMASGLPVVAYRDGAAEELIVDGVTGTLVPLGDVRGLAAALSDLVEDPARRARYGAAGRSRVRAEFDPRRAAYRFAQVLREVTDDR